MEAPLKVGDITPYLLGMFGENVGGGVLMGVDHTVLPYV